MNYCDDIRHETGNKISLIGLYGPDLLVPETPAVIPKLCAFVQIGSHPGKSFEDDIEIRTTIDDQVMSSTKLTVKPDKELGEDRFQTARLQIIMSPLAIEKPCTLRVRAYYMGQEYKSSALKIGCITNDPSPSPESSN